MGKSSKEILAEIQKKKEKVGKTQSKQIVKPKKAVRKQEKPKNKTVKKEKKTTIEKPQRNRAKTGQFVADTDSTMKSKTIRRQEFRQYLSKQLDLEQDNTLIQMLVEFSEDKDPKNKAKVLDLLIKRLPKRKVTEKEALSPIIEELLKLHMPHLLKEPIDDEEEDSKSLGIGETQTE